MICYGKLVEGRFKGKEPILKAIRDRRIMQTPEDQARSTLQAYVMIDWSYFKVIQREFGGKKAKEMHKKLWLRWVPELVNDSMKILQINKVKDIPTLGRLLRTIYDFTSSPLQPLEDNSKKFVGIINSDPFIEYQHLLKEKIGSPYFESLVEASKARLKHIVIAVDMGDVAEAGQDKSMCLGHSFSRIIVRKKKNRKARRV